MKHDKKLLECLVKKHGKNTILKQINEWASPELEQLSADVRRVMDNIFYEMDSDERETFVDVILDDNSGSWDHSTWIDEIINEFAELRGDSPADIEDLAADIELEAIRYCEETLKNKIYESKKISKKNKKLNEQLNNNHYRELFIDIVADALDDVRRQWENSFRYKSDSPSLLDWKRALNTYLKNLEYINREGGLDRDDEI